MQSERPIRYAKDQERSMRKIILIAALVSIAFLAGCKPEVGSKAWCEAMDEKPKGDWTANEAGEYAKNCVFRSED